MKNTFYIPFVIMMMGLSIVAQAQDFVAVGSDFNHIEAVDESPFTRPSTVVIPAPRNSRSKYTTTKTLDKNTSSWLSEKMDDPLFKKDNSAEAELRRYIAPFFDYIETELKYDTADLRRVQITNNFGREILTFEDLQNGGTALMILPKGNYNVEFVFGTDVHNTILIKK